MEEIRCKKCDTLMVKRQPMPPKSFDMYSGTTSDSSSSTASSVSTSAVFAPDVSGVPNQGQSHIPTKAQKKPIMLSTYYCPECDWITQIREKMINAQYE